MFPAGTCVTIAGPSLCDIKRFIPYKLSVGQLVLFFTFLHVQGLDNETETPGFTTQ